MLTDNLGVKTARLDSLTGLRFFAAFLVFGFHGLHYGQSREISVFSAGMSGVSFFYIVSGFVLAWSARDDDRPSLFFRRRLARIYPAYFVAWLVSLGLLVTSGKGVAATDLAAPTLLQSWVPLEAVYFAGSAVFWSLSCEAFFYVAFPALYKFLNRQGDRAIRLVALLCVAAPVALAALLMSAEGDPVPHWLLVIFPPTRLPEFVLGITLALLARRGQGVALPLWAACTLAATSVAVAGFAPESFSRVAVTIVPFALLVWSAADADLQGKSSMLRSKVVVTLGTWSYCFYLIHRQAMTLVFGALNRAGFESQELAGFALFASQAGALAVATIGAWLLHRLIEAPFERRLRPVPVPAR